MTQRNRIASSRRKREERYARSLKKVHVALVRLDSNGRGTISLAQARPALEFGLQFLWTLQWYMKPENIGKPYARSRVVTIWMEVERQELQKSRFSEEARASLQEIEEDLRAYIAAEKKGKHLPILEPCKELFGDLAEIAKELGY